MRQFFLLLAAIGFVHAASATESSVVPVTVKDAWVRLPPPGAKIGVVYLTLEAKQRMALTSAKSPVAETVEMHNMTMNKGVMQMRQLSTLPLDAGKPLQLEPGGLHLMLINLKKPLKIGDKVQLDLNFSRGKQAVGTVRVEAEVRVPTH